jgi:Ankyrin repeats (3 copies)
MRLATATCSASLRCWTPEATSTERIGCAPRESARGGLRGAGAPRERSSRAASQYGRTALHDASVNDHLEVVKLLLQRGADVRVVNQFGDTALHEASRWGHLEVVRLLLDNQADLAITNQHGWTSLHFAAAYSQLEVARVLLEATANVMAKDNVRRARLSRFPRSLRSSRLSGAACPCTSPPATTTWTWPACCWRLAPT